MSSHLGSKEDKNPIKPMFENTINNLLITVIVVMTSILAEEFNFTPKQIQKFVQSFQTRMEKEKSKWQQK